jgi:hypothetical protein
VVLATVEDTPPLIVPIRGGLTVVECMRHSQRHLGEQFNSLRELSQFLLARFYGSPLSESSTTLLAHQHVYQVIFVRSSISMVGAGPARGTHEDDCSRAVFDSSESIDHVRTSEGNKVIPSDRLCQTVLGRPSIELEEKSLPAEPVEHSR